MSSLEPVSFPPVVPPEIHLFFEPTGTLRMTIAENRSYPKVSLYQSSPLRRPGRYLSFLDGSGDEIVLVDSLDQLNATSREIAQIALRHRYLTSRIERISGLRQEFGVSYWDVETDRGPRDFVVQSLTEACQWLSERHLLLVDVDGNRFEIADRFLLDPVSRKHLDSVL